MKKLLITAAFALSAAIGYSQSGNVFPTPSGNTGIGTLSPTVKLDVVTGSNFSSSNLGFFGYRHGALSTNPSTGLYLRWETTSTLPTIYRSFKLQSVDNDNSEAFVAFNQRPTTNTTRAALTFGHNNVEFMRINQNGQVRISNGANDIETPAGYRLFVEEGILTERVKVALESTADWADYVFAPDYELMPLEEVEAFTKENGHLPNLPSAEEMVANGLDVAQTAKFQQEKIEELTLYLIEMKKQVEALKAEIATLKEQKQ